MILTMIISIKIMKLIQLKKQGFEIDYKINSDNSIFASL